MNATIVWIYSSGILLCTKHTSRKTTEILKRIGISISDVLNKTDIFISSTVLLYRESL